MRSDPALRRCAASPVCWRGLHARHAKLQGSGQRAGEVAHGSEDAKQLGDRPQPPRERRKIPWVAGHDARLLPDRRVCAIPYRDEDTVFYTYPCVAVRWLPDDWLSMNRQLALIELPPTPVSHY
jgi:hypothetical protein